MKHLKEKITLKNCFTTDSRDSLNGDKLKIGGKSYCRRNSYTATKRY